MPEIFELTTDAEWREALPVILELRPGLDIEATLQRRTTLLSQGYKLFGLVLNGKFVCVAGVAIHPHIARGADFWVHDLVTVSEARSRGYGKAMMRYLEQLAQSMGCSRISVHTQLKRDQAQKFYEHRLGYERYAVVFKSELILNTAPAQR